MGLPDSSQPITIVIVGSLYRGEESTGDADERTTARTGLSSRFRSFRDIEQNLEHSDGSKGDMGQETTDAMA